jgi:hypothetical protein
MQLFLAFLLVVISALAADLPDRKLTPGATASVPLAKLCEKGYASSVRDVPDSVKEKVYAEYGIQVHLAGEFEIDHLISLELSGSNEITNLWPQSYLTKPWNAHLKDALEDRLHAMVCAAHPTLTLEQAQQAIRTDWIAAYRRVFGATIP